MAYKIPYVGIWVSTQNDTLTEKHDAYFFVTPRVLRYAVKIFFSISIRFFNSRILSRSGVIGVAAAYGLTWRSNFS